MTIKLASFGFTDELLEYTEYLLDQNASDLSRAEELQSSTFVITCYTEKYLRDPSDPVLEQKFR